MSTPEVAPDITILLQNIERTPENMERTRLRYSGLFEALQAEGCDPAMVFGHVQFGRDGNFSEGVVPRSWATDGVIEEFMTVGPFQPTVVRDLTMPRDEKRLYREPGVTLVHNPEFNAFVRDKSKVAGLFPDIQPSTLTVTNQTDALWAVHAIPGSKVVVKPVTGSQSKGIHIGDKAEVAKALAKQVVDYDANPNYPAIVQEFIETEDGIAELGINGRHNFRVIMIGGMAIFGFARLAEKDQLMIAGDNFRNLVFHRPEDFPEDVHASIEVVREGLATLPDGLNTVVAADLMRGYSAIPEDSRVYLCELNRRPVRNSRYDSDNPGALWAADQWDAHEATLLAAKRNTIVA